MDTDHHDAGMLYGDVLHDALLSKFEATVPGGGDYEPPGHPESQGSYDAYARGEIVDRGPDVAFLASDAPRHDPGLSRSVLNLRHKGVRGSVSATPASHEEMFYGFTDRDPRGTNDAPRLDLLRGQNASRQKLLTVRMGDNDDNHQVESQWTGPAISRAKQAMNRRTKATLAIFSDQSVGATAHSHHATNPRSAVIARGAEMTAAGETMAGSGAARFSGGDQRPAFEADRRAGRGVDAAYMTGAGAAPWHRVTGDAELGVQTYGAVRGAGRERVSQAAQGGGRLNTLQTEQAWGASAAGPAPTRKVLAATMGAAARYRGAARSGAADHAVVSAPSVTEGQGFTAGAALTPARDVTRAYRNVIEEQARRPAVPDGAGGVGGAARGLTPAAHPERALRLTDVAVVAPDHLTNVAAIVRGLREGTASSRRRIAGAVIADGARGRRRKRRDGARRGGPHPRRRPRPPRLCRRRRRRARRRLRRGP